MKKKFAFLLMGEQYDPMVHRAVFETEKQITLIQTVRSFEEAHEKILELQKEGFGAVELCGAFGKEKAQRLTELTRHTMAIGYVVHEPELDELFQNFFSSF